MIAVVEIEANNVRVLSQYTGPFDQFSRKGLFELICRTTKISIILKKKVFFQVVSKIGLRCLSFSVSSIIA